MTPLELLKLHKVLVASPPNGVDESVTSLRICEVAPAGVHELPFLEDISLADVLVVLVGVSSTHDECTEAGVGYYRFVAFGAHSW